MVGSPQPRLVSAAVPEVGVSMITDEWSSIQLTQAVQHLRAQQEMMGNVMQDLSGCVNNHAEFLTAHKNQVKEAFKEMDRRTHFLDRTRNGMLQDMAIINNKDDANAVEREALMEKAVKVEKEFQFQMVGIQVELAAMRQGVDQVPILKKNIEELAAQKLEQDG